MKNARNRKFDFHSAFFALENNRSLTNESHRPGTVLTYRGSLPLTPLPSIHLEQARGKL